jgi:ABC-type transport system involved in multi-copper enzyme maturation permease subunit
MPVLMKEMRGRMRGGRTPWVVFLAAAPIVVLGLLVLIPASHRMAEQTEMNWQGQHLAETGKTLFAWLIGIEGVLIGLLAPALTSGSISLEREQRTLEFLLLTRMSPWRIVLGKYFSALSFLLLMIATALPVAAVGFMLGGVDPALFFSFMGIAITTCMGFGAIGLWCSSAAPRTYTAVAGAYGMTIGWLILVPLIMLGLSVALPYDDGVAYQNLRDYLPILAVILAVAALPTGVFSLVITSILRRRQAWYVNAGLWLGCFIVLAALVLNDPGTAGTLNAWMRGNTEEILLIGNPITAFGVLTELASGDDSFQPLGAWFIPVCMGINLLVTLFFLQATALRLKRAAPDTGVGRGE